MLKRLTFLIGFIFCSPTFYAQNWDINLLKDLHVNRNKGLDGTMLGISRSEGIIGVVVPLSVAGLYYMDKKTFTPERALNVVSSVVVASVQTYVLKRIVNRPRPVETYPYLQPLEQERRFSFPSGHTTNAFATAMALSLNYKRWYVVLPSFVWAGSVGYARMHEGVHYPSDVLAGAVIGMSTAWVTYKINKWLRKRFFVSNNQAVILQPK